MKRGAIGKFVLLIGAMIIMIILFLSYSRVLLWTGSKARLDMAEDLAQNVKSVLENMEAYPSDAALIIELPRPVDYELSVTQNEVLVTLQDEVTVRKSFFVHNSIILPSYVQDSQIIKVYKTEYHVFVTNALFCDINDNICDVGCAIVKKCDPRCYIDRQKDGVCNLYCVDINKDDFVNIQDIDGICDPDCEGEFKDIDC